MLLTHEMCSSVKKKGQVGVYRQAPDAATNKVDESKPNCVQKVAQKYNR